MDARPFDTINDILRCLSLVQSLYEDRNAPNWRKREPTHMRLSGTDKLSNDSALAQHFLGLYGVAVMQPLRYMKKI